MLCAVFVTFCALFVSSSAFIVAKQCPSIVFSTAVKIGITTDELQVHIDCTKLTDETPTLAIQCTCDGSASILTTCQNTNSQSNGCDTGGQSTVDFCFDHLQPNRKVTCDLTATPDSKVCIGDVQHDSFPITTDISSTSPEEPLLNATWQPSPQNSLSPSIVSVMWDFRNCISNDPVDIAFILYKQCGSSINYKTSSCTKVDCSTSAGRACSAEDADYASTTLSPAVTFSSLEQYRTYVAKYCYYLKSDPCPTAPGSLTCYNLTFTTSQAAPAAGNVQFTLGTVTSHSAHFEIDYTDIPASNTNFTINLTNCGTSFTAICAYSCAPTDCDDSYTCKPTFTGLAAFRSYTAHLHVWSNSGLLDTVPDIMLITNEEAPAPEDITTKLWIKTNDTATFNVSYSNISTSWTSFQIFANSSTGLTALSELHNVTYAATSCITEENFTLTVANLTPFSTYNALLMVTWDDGALNKSIPLFKTNPSPPILHIDALVPTATENATVLLYNWMAPDSECYGSNITFYVTAAGNPDCLQNSVSYDCSQMPPHITLSTPNCLHPFRNYTIFFWAVSDNDMPSENLTFNVITEREAPGRNSVKFQSSILSRTTAEYFFEYTDISTNVTHFNLILTDKTSGQIHSNSSTKNVNVNDADQPVSLNITIAGLGACTEYSVTLNVTSDFGLDNIAFPSITTDYSAPGLIANSTVTVPAATSVIVYYDTQNFDCGASMVTFSASTESCQPTVKHFTCDSNNRNLTATVELKLEDCLHAYRPHNVTLSAVNECPASNKVIKSIFTLPDVPPSLSATDVRIQPISNATFNISIFYPAISCMGPNTSFTAEALYIAPSIDPPTGCVVPLPSLPTNSIVIAKTAVMPNCPQNDESVQLPISGLIPNSAYSINIWAHNDAGNSSAPYAAAGYSTLGSSSFDIPAASSASPYIAASPKCKVTNSQLNFQLSASQLCDPVVDVDHYDVFIIGAAYYSSTINLNNIAPDFASFKNGQFKMPLLLTNSLFNPFDGNGDCCTLTDGSCQFTTTGMRDKFQPNSKLYKAPAFSTVSIFVRTSDTSDSSPYAFGRVSGGTKFSIMVRAASKDSVSNFLYMNVVTAESTDVGSIVGIVIGVLIAVLLVVAVLYVVVRRPAPAREFVKRLHRRSWLGNGGSATAPFVTPVQRDFDPMKFNMPNTYSKSIKLSDFASQIHQLQRDTNFQFQSQFDRLDEISPKIPNVETEMSARTDDARMRNRYVDILPFDENRVVLHDTTTDYINASYINGYNTRREYIAAQGPIGENEQRLSAGTPRPKVATSNDFWHMIWQENTRFIVMLTQCVENGRAKCAQYWPKDISGWENFDDFAVTLKSQDDKRFYIQRMLEVSDGEQTRSITHFQFDWDDFSAPDDPTEMLEFIRIVGRTAGDHEAPILVHCSAGVGRTGTYIALDCLLKELATLELEDSIDIFGCVYGLRKQRVKMVQTESQYIFIHMCIKEYIDQTFYSSQRDLVGKVEDGYPPDSDIYDHVPEPPKRDSNIYESPTAEEDDDRRPPPKVKKPPVPIRKPTTTTKETKM